jgi:hypothetical protein
LSFNELGNFAKGAANPDLKAPSRDLTGFRMSRGRTAPGRHAQVVYGGGQNHVSRALDGHGAGGQVIECGIMYACV